MLMLSGLLNTGGAVGTAASVVPDVNMERSMNAAATDVLNVRPRLMDLFFFMI